MQIHSFSVYNVLNRFDWIAGTLPPTFGAVFWIFTGHPINQPINKMTRFRLGFEHNLTMLHDKWKGTISIQYWVFLSPFPNVSRQVERKEHIYHLNGRVNVGWWGKIVSVEKHGSVRAIQVYCVIYHWWDKNAVYIGITFPVNAQPVLQHIQQIRWLILPIWDHTVAYLFCLAGQTRHRSIF